MCFVVHDVLFCWKCASWWLLCGELCVGCVWTCVLFVYCFLFWLYFRGVFVLGVCVGGLSESYLCGDLLLVGCAVCKSWCALMPCVEVDMFGWEGRMCWVGDVCCIWFVWELDE